MKQKASSFMVILHMSSTARFTLNLDQEQAWNNKDTNDGYGGKY